MPKSIDLELIAKIVQTGNFRDVLQSKFTADLLSNHEAKSMFQDIWNHYFNPKHPGRVPSRRMMLRRHPTFEPSKHTTKDSVPELCEEIRKAAIARRLVDVAHSVDDTIKDPYKTLERMRSGVLSISAMRNTSRDLLFHEYGEEILRKYELLKNAETIQGIPYPWERLNTETQGMLPEELIIFYGRLKSMKTFIGVYLAVHAYYEARRRVLFYSAEMGPEQVTMRVAAAVAGIDYKLLKRGKLPEGQENSLKDALSDIARHEKEDSIGGHRPSLLITSDKDDQRGIGGVSHIRSKAEEFQPDLIIVDSFYRLRDDRTGRNDYDWKVQSAITQDLKHLAQQLQIPVVGITQANRTSAQRAMSEGMEDASYADAMGQETDLGIRVVKGEKTPGGVVLNLIIAAAREIDMYGFQLRLRPFTRCEFVGLLDPPAATEEANPPRTARVRKKELKNKEKPRNTREARSHRAAIEEIKTKKQREGK